MGDRFTIDGESTYDEFLKFLSNFGQGLEVALFTKPIEYLFLETRKEVVLKYNYHMDRLERHAQVAKFKIYNPVQKKCWVEIARSYPNGKYIPQIQSYAGRETKFRGEPYKDAALRGLQEEFIEIWKRLRYFPRVEDMQYLIQQPDDHGEYDSSVYPGICTVQHAQWYELVLKEYLGFDASQKEEFLVVTDYANQVAGNDNWTRMHLQSVPIDRIEEDFLGAA